ncbi:MAG: hypothetical protein IT200_09880 [Thermoleophilia bacterium]|nr:hypothetical protein [Thermoleophilia bacterium]
MTRRTRTALTLAAASAAALCAAGQAAAVPTEPVQKAGPAFAIGSSITAAWNPSTFGTFSKGRNYEIRLQDMTVVSPLVIATVPAAETTRTFSGLDNGHRYRVSVRAFEVPCVFLAPGGGSCLAYAGSSLYSTPDAREFRMDATDPTGSVNINGGALYTNSRTVNLTLAATDPASAGQPASGIDGVQISEDTTFSCNPLTSTADCPVPVTNPRSFTLADGLDGNRTVRVRYRDKASQYNPGGLIALLTVSGNASATSTDTIVLDRSQPTPVVTMGIPTADAGVPVAFSAAGSTDATSGVDPTSAVWDFGDGTAPVNALQLNKSFANPGTHTGSLTVRDRAGNTNTQAFSFTVTGAPAPGGGGVTITNPGTGTAALTDPIRGAKRLNRAVQGKKLRIRVRLANRIQVRVSILRIAASGRAVVRRQVRTAGPGFAVFTFTAPKAGRHVVRIKAGADTLSFPMGIARR